MLFWSVVFWPINHNNNNSKEVFVMGLMVTGNNLFLFQFIVIYCFALGKSMRLLEHTLNCLPAPLVYHKQPFYSRLTFPANLQLRCSMWFGLAKVTWGKPNSGSWERFSSLMKRTKELPFPSCIWIDERIWSLEPLQPSYNYEGKSQENWSKGKPESWHHWDAKLTM